MALTTFRKIKTAQDLAPRLCQCGAKLPPTHHGVTPDYYERCWHITCGTCHATYVWSWSLRGGCWKVRSSLPLFDTRVQIGGSQDD